MAIFDGSHHLTLTVVDVDDNLITIDAQVVDEGWAGTVTAFTTIDALRGFAEELARFDAALDGEAAFESLELGVLGAVSLRFHTWGLARRLACHVRLVGDDDEESSPRLAIMLDTEPTYLERFVEAFSRLAEAVDGEATLTCA